jgi:hypothetical protein
MVRDGTTQVVEATPGSLQPQGQDVQQPVHTSTSLSPNGALITPEQRLDHARDISRNTYGIKEKETASYYLKENSDKIQIINNSLNTDTPPANLSDRDLSIRDSALALKKSVDTFGRDNVVRNYEALADQLKSDKFQKTILKDESARKTAEDAAQLLRDAAQSIQDNSYAPAAAFTTDAYNLINSNPAVRDSLMMAIGFVPIVGGVVGFIDCASRGDWTGAALNAGSVVLDVATAGAGGAILRGSVKAVATVAVKEAAESIGKKIATEVLEEGIETQAKKAAQEAVKDLSTEGTKEATHEALKQGVTEQKESILKNLNSKEFAAKLTNAVDNQLEGLYKIAQQPNGLLKVQDALRGLGIPEDKVAGLAEDIKNGLQSSDNATLLKKHLSSSISKEIEDAYTSAFNNQLAQALEAKGFKGEELSELTSSAEKLFRKDFQKSIQTTVDKAVEEGVEKFKNRHKDDETDQQDPSSPISSNIPSRATQSADIQSTPNVQVNHGVTNLDKIHDAKIEKGIDGNYTVDATGQVSGGSLEQAEVTSTNSNPLANVTIYLPEKQKSEAQQTQAATK